VGEDHVMLTANMMMMMTVGQLGSGTNVCGCSVNEGEWKRPVGDSIDNTSTVDCVELDWLADTAAPAQCRLP